jgi:hypothetical protein
MINAGSTYSVEMPTSSSDSMVELLAEYWKLAEFETGLHRLYHSVVDGSQKFSFAQQSLTDLLDRTAQRQSEIVEAITPITPKTTEELKAKARVILRCLSVEDGDVDGMLVRAVVQDLIGMPIRATDMDSTVAAMTSKKRSRKTGVDIQTTGQTTGMAGADTAMVAALQSASDRPIC